MTFPVVFKVGQLSIHAHAIMELLGIVAGFLCYRSLRNRRPAERLGAEQTGIVIAGVMAGAMIGARLMAWLENPALYFPHMGNPNNWIYGKSIVGAILGAWAGVEIAKKAAGIRQSTGDLMVFPMVVGIAIGRVGCFLEGLDDQTCGTYTDLPWGVDFGDGPRHPTQLYEILFLIMLGVVLGFIWKRLPRGVLFTWFCVGYFGFRLLIEFIKPRYAPYGGLSMIQIACIGAIAAAVIRMRKLQKEAALA